MSCRRYRPHIVAYCCVSFTLIFFGLMISVLALFKLDASLAQAWLAGPTTMAVGFALCGKVIIDCQVKGAATTTTVSLSVPNLNVQSLANEKVPQKPQDPADDQLIGITIENPGFTYEGLQSPTASKSEFVVSKALAAETGLANEAFTPTAAPDQSEWRHPDRTALFNEERLWLPAKMRQCLLKYQESKLTNRGATKPDFTLRPLQSPVESLASAQSAVSYRAPEKHGVYSSTTFGRRASTTHVTNNARSLCSAHAVPDQFVVLNDTHIKPHASQTSLGPSTQQAFSLSTETCGCTNSPNKYLLAPLPMHTLPYSRIETSPVWHLRPGVTYHNSHTPFEKPVSYSSKAQPCIECGTLYQGETFLLNDRQYLI